MITTMTNIPALFQDAKNLLTEQGFATSNTWYHGTSSALVDSIKNQGLIRSGDSVLKDAAKKTMATIGNIYTESIEPVFLTPSKALAFYWAEQAVRNRSVRIEDNGQPVVFTVVLPDELNRQVKPDVGAASLLLLKEGENFMAYLTAIYQTNSLDGPDINLMQAERNEYLRILGMAYINADIEALHMKLITDEPRISNIIL
jgi:hypothetical protein